MSPSSDTHPPEDTSANKEQDIFDAIFPPSQIQPTQKHHPERHYTQPDPTPLWKILLEVAAIAVVLAYTYAAFQQLKAMKDTYDQIVKQTNAAQQSAATALWALVDSEESTEFTLQQMEAQTRAQQGATDAATKSLDATINQFHLDQRAWVGIEEIEEIVDGNNRRFSVRLVNSGKTPAFNVRTNHEVKILPFPQKPTFPISPRYPGMTLVSGGKSVMTLEQIAIDESTLKDIKLEKQWLWIFGKIWYEDVFGKPHYTEFCSIMQKGGSGFNGCIENRDAN